MHVVDVVRRRLIASTCRDVIEQAVPLKIFSRDTIIDGLVICNGNVDEFNKHYNAWRKLRAHKPIVVTIGADDGDVRSSDEPQFISFITDAHARQTVHVGDTYNSELLERGIEVQLLLREFGHHIDRATAAKCLFVCDGDWRECIKILHRLVPLDFDTLHVRHPRWLVSNVSRLYRDPWASLREDWRKTDVNRLTEGQS